MAALDTTQLRSLVRQPVTPVIPSDMPVIAWEEACTAVSGGMPEDPESIAFLLEMLVEFYHESQPRLETLMRAAGAFRSGAAEVATQPGGHVRIVERAIKDAAHALKGSSSQMRLYRIWKTAEVCELPCKGLIAQEDAGQDVAAAKAELLHSYCCSPCKEIKCLLSEFRQLAIFIQTELPSLLASSGAGSAEELLSDPKHKQQLAAISEDGFLATYVAPFQWFWAPGTQGPAAGSSAGSGQASGGTAAAAVAPAASSAGTGGSAGGGSYPGAGVPAVVEAVPPTMADKGGCCSCK